MINLEAIGISIGKNDVMNVEIENDLSIKEKGEQIEVDDDYEVGNDIYEMQPQIFEEIATSNK